MKQKFHIQKSLKKKELLIQEYAVIQSDLRKRNPPTKASIEKHSDSYHIALLKIIMPNYRWLCSPQKKPLSKP